MSVQCPICVGSGYQFTSSGHHGSHEYNQNSSLERPKCCVCEGDGTVDVDNVTSGGFLKKGTCPDCEGGSIHICKKCNYLICKMCDNDNCKRC